MTSAQKIIVVGLGEGFAGDERAGVVDQKVEAAEEGDGLGDQRIATLGRGEIGAGAAHSGGRGLAASAARVPGRPSALLR